MHTSASCWQTPIGYYRRRHCSSLSRNQGPGPGIWSLAAWDLVPGCLGPGCACRPQSIVLLCSTTEQCQKGCVCQDHVGQPFLRLKRQQSPFLLQKAQTRRMSPQQYCARLNVKEILEYFGTLTLHFGFIKPLGPPATSKSSLASPCESQCVLRFISFKKIYTVYIYIYIQYSWYVRNISKWIGKNAKTFALPRQKQASHPECRR